MYYWIREDKRYRHLPEIQDFYTTFRRRDFVEDNASRIPSKNVVFTNSAMPLDYVDILDSQMFVVSQRVCDVFKIYDPSIEFKHFCFLNNELNTYKRYFAPVLKSIACLKEYKSNVPVLVTERLTDNYIFRVQDAKKEIVIIRLEVAESLLRRGIHDFELIEIYTFPLNNGN